MARAAARGRIGVGRARVVRGAGRGRRPVAGPSPLPWDAAAEGSSQTSLLERNNAIAGLRGDQAYEDRQVGFGAGADNPYSQVSQLKQQRDRGLKGNLQGAGYQLYSGSTVNHARGIQGAYNKGFTNLQDQYNHDAEKRRQQEQDVNTTYQHNLDQARENALNRAIEAAPEPAPVGVVGRPRQPRRQQKKQPRGRGRV